MTKRIRAKHKIDRRLGENIWGRPKSPLNKREYGPGQHGQRRERQAVRLRPAAEGQAEAQGLLRQHHRAPVPQHLRRGVAAQGLDLGAPDRPARAPARRRSSIAPSSCRRCSPRASSSATATSRSTAGASTIAELPLQGRRRGRGEGEVASAAAGARSDQELAERDVPDYVEVDHNKHDAPSSRACRRCPTCPIRCRWSRTWWSSSTRASREFYSRPAKLSGSNLQRPPLVGGLSSFQAAMSTSSSGRRAACGGMATPSFR